MLISVLQLLYNQKPRAGTSNAIFTYCLFLCVCSLSLDKKPLGERRSEVTPLKRTESSQDDGVQGSVFPSAKVARLKAAHSRSDSQHLTTLVFFQCLERVETMRIFWELKHIEMEGESEQVCGTLAIILLWISATLMQGKFTHSLGYPLYTFCGLGNKTRGPEVPNMHAGLCSYRFL